MSQRNSSKTPTTTIKIAPKEANRRNNGGADPGPGDLSAAPSEAPQVVDIPNAPTPSELVVKSAASKKLPTINEHPSSYKAVSKMYGAHLGTSKHSKYTGSHMGPAASNPSTGAPREPTSSKQLSAPPASTMGTSPSTDLKSTSGPRSVSVPKNATEGYSSNAAEPTSTNDPNKPDSVAPSVASDVSGTPVSTSPNNTGSPTPTSSAGGVTHDEIEETEGEVEHPEGEASPTAQSIPGDTSPKIGLKDSSHAQGPSKTVTGSTSSYPKKMGQVSDTHHPSVGPKAKAKKVTKFRYHKRITVRTTGKTNPSTILHKVNEKDKKVSITPSTIDDMDPQELMKRAGIKGGKQAHWRVRLRQTKRFTKDGKTTTQTKVAYRDSEGNKRVRTSTSPFCKACGKKLEDCKCDDIQH